MDIYISSKLRSAETVCNPCNIQPLAVPSAGHVVRCREPVCLSAGTLPTVRACANNSYPVWAHSTPPPHVSLDVLRTIQCGASRGVSHELWLGDNISCTGCLHTSSIYLCIWISIYQVNFGPPKKSATHTTFNRWLSPLRAHVVRCREPVCLSAGTLPTDSSPRVGSLRVLAVRRPTPAHSPARRRPTRRPARKPARRNC